jgi:hypothetical protein
MKLHDKEAILAELQRGQAVLLHALKDVPEDVAGRAPGPGKWSILECVEHLAVAEDYLLSQMISARRCDAAVVDERREALITARGADRTRLMLSPEVGRPTGRFSTLREATERFLSARGRTLGFVENANDDLHCRLTTHPLLGTVNCYEMLLVIAVHPHRHALQVEEIKAALAPAPHGEASTGT